MKSQFPLLLLLLGLTSLCGAKPTVNRWAAVKQPTTAGGIAQSIGKYTAGCLRGAIRLPADGEGFQAMRLSRKRLFGHPDLIRFIEKMGHNAIARGWGPLLIGDLGQPRGGPTLTGHSSHQTGLDVDIWYLLSKQAAIRSLTAKERETWNAPSMLRAKSDKLDLSEWSPVHEQVLKTAALMPEVERIFVNPSIKRWLCDNETDRTWLNKIRPWWGHDDHFHVRLKCPEHNPDCSSQEAVPSGAGCDATLDWWFSDEARLALVKKGPVVKPTLPPQCESVLND